MNVWKCKLIFPTDTLQQKIEITDIKSFLAGENSSVLIILALIEQVKQGKRTPYEVQVEEKNMYQLKENNCTHLCIFINQRFS